MQKKYRLHLFFCICHENVLPLQAKCMYMKKIIICLFLCLPFAVNAEVLFSDDFEYADGSVLTVNKEWFLQWGGESSMAIVTPGLEFGTYPCNAAHGLLIEGDVTNDMPHHAFEQVKNGDVYVSLLLEPTFVTKSGYFLTLRDEKANNTAYNYCGRIYAGVDEEYNNIVGLRFFKKADAVFADKILDSDKTYLVVMRYHIVQGNNNDEISLYLFDAMPDNEPETPLIGPLTDPNAPDINPAHVVFHSYDDDGMLTVDGLRVATTFWEAVGLASEPEPQRLTTPAAKADAASKKLSGGHILIERNGILFDMLGKTL